MPAYQISLALGVLAIGAYYLLDGLAQDVLYDAVRLGAAGAIFIGARRRPRAEAAAWYLIGVGQLLFGLGDVTWDFYKHVRNVDPFPSLADVFFLGAYPALALGVLLQLRRVFPGRDRAALTNAAIVATGTGLVVWVLVVHPTANEPDLTLPERGISLAYPLMDVVLVAMGARLAFARRVRTLGASLWDLGLVSLLVADTAFLATQLAGTYEDGTLIDAAFLLSGVLWAAAALHGPAAAPAVSVIEETQGVTGGRVAALFGAVLIGPLLIAVQGAGGEDVNLGVTLTGSVALMSLALLRMTGPSLAPRVRNVALLAAAVGALVTLSLNTVPVLRFTYSSSELRVAVETSQALIAFLVTHLLYLRFRRTRLLGDLLLVYGIGLQGAANLFFVAALVAGRQPGSTAFYTWAPLLTRALSASAIVWAAWALPRHVNVDGIVPRVIAAQLGSVCAVAIAVVAFQDSLPLAITSAREVAGDRDVEGHAVLLGGQLILMALFWLGAGGFVHRSGEDPGPLTAALVAGFILAGFSRLSFSLHPTLYTDTVDTGDFLRLGCYLVFLVGAGWEIYRYWQGLAQAAVSTERQRTARELHDGLVQELSFIRSQTAGLTSGRASPAMLRQIALAAERALDESREAVNVLSGSEQDLSFALRRAAEDIASRSGVAVHMENAATLDLPPETVAPLSRIVREATSNAVRHGKATAIDVCVERTRDGSLRVAVHDDGSGFDPDAASGNKGFGLRSMRQRAVALGGHLRLTSTPGEGTTVEVVVPLG